MTDAGEWQGPVGDVWAVEWRRTDRTFRNLTPRLLERVADLPGSSVLDIGCGAGEVSVAIAAARPEAQVLGLDISEGLVATARARAAGMPNARFEVGDAARWPQAGFAADVLVSRHGVMFFDDPVAAFANLRSLAAPGAGLVFSCFAAVTENPWAGDVVAAVRSGQGPAGPGGYAPGPFAFADPERVRTILAEAEWQDPAFEPLRYRNVTGEGADPVEDALAFFRRIGPAAPILRALSDDERAGAESRLRALLERHRDGAKVAFDAAAWIVSARAPGKMV